MDIQARYWQAYVDLIRDACYINCYRAQTEQIDWRITVGSAILSSGSIAGWAIWRDLAFLWSFLIAASQVFQVVRPYLPYRRRLTSLTKLAVDLDALSIVIEDEWFKVSRGELDEVEIQKALITLRKKKLDLVRKSFESTLPENTKLIAKANEQSKIFFATNYGIDI